MSLLLGSSGAHLEQHAVTLQLDRWGGFVFGNLEKITRSPNVMAFPIQIFPLRLAILFLQLPLLPLDPTQLGYRKYTNLGFFVAIGCLLIGCQTNRRADTDALSKASSECIRREA